MKESIMLIVAVCFMTVASYARDLDGHYQTEVMVGQKWQFEVTDLETNEVLIANAILEGDSIINGPVYEEYGYALRITYDNAPERRYFMYYTEDEMRHIGIYSDIKKSDLVLLIWDCMEGEQCFSNWSNRNYTVTAVDYIFVGDRARKRITLTDAESGFESRYVTGVGLDYFETSAEDWGHHRSYRLIKTEYPDGTELTPEDFDVPRLVPDNKYYQDGMTIKYDGYMAGIMNDEPFDCRYEIVGDTVAFHVPSKKVEFYKRGRKLYTCALFDINGQVYYTGYHGVKSFKPFVVYDLQIGDASYMWDPPIVVTDIFEIEIDGSMRKVIKFSDEEETGNLAFYGYWVEGVGPHWGHGFFYSLFGYDWMYLKGLYRDGECLFSYDSLYRTDGIGSIPSKDTESGIYEESDVTDTPFYNLQGQRIARPVPGQPYIRNGKKYMGTPGGTE